jgi:hypothetical protein
MEIFVEETQYIIERFDNSALKFIHFKSVRNFIMHINDIKNQNIKDTIANLLENYFFEVKREDDLISEELSQYLFFEYITKIAKYYEIQVGFRRVIRKSTVMLAMVIDGLLYFSGVLSKLFNIPLTTIFVLFTYTHQVLRFKTRLYGFKY